jgi:single-strand DNA-binding protein
MMNLNEVFLTGNIGKKPEIKYTKEEKPVLTFSIAQNSKTKDDKKITEWYNIVVFDKLAETLSLYLEAGMPVLVKGVLKVNNYEDKDKNKRTKVYIVAHKVIFTGGTKESKTAEIPEDVNFGIVPATDDDDINF